MGIREKLNQKPQAAAAIAGAILVVALVLIAWSLSSDDPPGPIAGQQVFLTRDDGKTFAAGSPNELFDPAAASTAQAIVFRCGSGEPFVGYLVRYKEAIKSQLREAGGKGPDALQRAMAEVGPAGSEAKKPLTGTWTDMEASDVAAITIVKCPSPADQPTPVVAP